MKRFLLGVCLIVFLHQITLSQTTVFSDNFNTSTGASYTATPGPIGSSSIWTLSRSGVDWGGRIDPTFLDLTNDATATANVNGWSFGSTPTTSFSSPYTSTLNANSGLVTWFFNMRQIRSDPAGFGSGNYGVAFILAGGSTTAATAGNGYAVVLGQTGTTDPIRLVKYNNGLQGTLTDLIISNTSGLTDFGTEYLSIKITYDPSSDTWELFLRSDGTSAFADPAAGTLVSQGTVVDNTYTGSSLGFLGGYWQGSTGANQPAYFDNVSVLVNAAASNTITTGTVSSPPFVLANCAATAAGTVDFTSIGTYNAGNTFIAQLSDDLGSFASPVSVGSISLSGVDPSGTINITIPAGTVGGSGYRIRVSSNSPVATGSNSSTFTITQNGVGGCASSHTDYYRSFQTGNWNLSSSWESSPDNSNWISATLTPTNSANSIFIRNGHTITATSSLTIDQVEIQNGGTLENNMAASNQLTVANGTGDDIDIKSGGVYLVSSSQSYTNSFSLNASATVHIEGGGTIQVGNGGSVGGGNSAYGTTTASYIWDDASIFRWNSTTTPGIQTTFFPDATIAVIPIFRFTASPSLSMGGGTATLVNGRLEATSAIAFTGASTKTFRNGIVNSADIDGAAGTSLKFIINGSIAQLGGTGNILTPSAGLEIGSVTGTTVTVNSSKTITGDISLISTNTFVDLGTNNLTVTGNITGGGTNAYIRTSSTGSLVLNSIGAGGKFFPIGYDSYNPLTITNGSNQNYTVRVENNIVPGIAFPGFGINRTWNISAGSTTPGVTVAFQYAGADANVNVPQPQPMEIMMYNVAWNILTGQTNISPSGSDPYTITSASTMTINNTATPYAIGKAGGYALPLDYYIVASARKQDNSGIISWNVFSIDNVSSFEVQRSINGGAFSTIATISPQDNVYDYTYTEANLEKGTLLYRLKVNRTTGGTRYSNVVAIINGTNGLLITSVVPNPVIQSAMITISAAKKQTVQFEVYSISGAKVLTQAAAIPDGVSTVDLKTGSLPAGIYHVLATAPDAKTVYRFIKQ